jgi:hypothetical protein
VNERIKELWSQTVRNYGHSGQEICAQQFAELIVKDILVIVEGYCETTPEIYGLPLDILEHFDMEIDADESTNP